MFVCDIWWYSYKLHITGKFSHVSSALTEALTGVLAVRPYQIVVLPQLCVVNIVSQKRLYCLDFLVPLYQSYFSFLVNYIYILRQLDHKTLAARGFNQYWGLWRKFSSVARFDIRIIIKKRRQQRVEKQKELVALMANKRRNSSVLKNLMVAVTPGKIKSSFKRYRCGEFGHLRRNWKTRKRKAKEIDQDINIRKIKRSMKLLFVRCLVLKIVTVG